MLPGCEGRTSWGCSSAAGTAGNAGSPRSAPPVRRIGAPSANVAKHRRLTVHVAYLRAPRVPPRGPIQRSRVPAASACPSVRLSSRLASQGPPGSQPRHRPTTDGQGMTPRRLHLLEISRSGLPPSGPPPTPQPPTQRVRYHRLVRRRRRLRQWQGTRQPGPARRGKVPQAARTACRETSAGPVAASTRLGRPMDSGSSAPGRPQGAA